MQLLQDLISVFLTILLFMFDLCMARWLMIFFSYVSRFQFFFFLERVSLGMQLLQQMISLHLILADFFILFLDTNSGDFIILAGFVYNR